MLLTDENLKIYYPEIHNFLSNKYSIKNEEFPCAFARSSFNTKNMFFVVLPDFISEGNIEKIKLSLKCFSEILNKSNISNSKKRFTTLVTIFTKCNFSSQKEFNFEFFNLLKKLNSLDEVKWVEGVSKDPESPNFEFCFDGKVWFPVTLSPMHKHIIRQSLLTIISFQPKEVFDINIEFYEDEFKKIRAGIYKKIEKIYSSGKFPMYLEKKTNSKNYVQYVADDDLLIKETFIFPFEFK